MPKADDYRPLVLVEDKMKPYKGPINQPCSACSAGDYKMEFHDHDHVPVEKRGGYKPTPDNEMYIVSVLLLCAKCKQPIKATINSPQWIRCEWIGPSGECQGCNQMKKREREVGDGA